MTADKKPRRRWTAKERADVAIRRAEKHESLAAAYRNEADKIIRKERARAQAVLDALSKEG